MTNAKPSAAPVAGPDPTAPPLVTVVVPMKDEADNVLPMAAEIATTFAVTEFAWEAVFVDDGSGDATRERLRQLAAPCRFIALARNCGQSAALMAGVEAARGTWIATLDGDGQNDPADLPALLRRAVTEDLDMVNGIRARRQDNAVRRICSRIANAVRNRLTRESVRDVGCSTRVLRRAIFLRLPFFHGMHRFLPTLARMRGARIAEIPVNHRPRAAGRTKYGINNRLWSGLRDIFGVRWLLKRNRQWQVVPDDVVGPTTPVATPSTPTGEAAATP